MKTSIVRIGNSKGIRIPKTLLEECHLEGEVELEPRKFGLMVRSLLKPRQGWTAAFCRMGGEGEDALLDAHALSQTQWDKTEWEW